MEINDLNTMHPDYAGLPVEPMGKMKKLGNPAEFLTIQDVADLKAFIKGQRDVINAQQRRIAELKQIASDLLWCASESQELDWEDGFDRVIDDDGRTIFENDLAQKLWDLAHKDYGL